MDFGDHLVTTLIQRAGQGDSAAMEELCNVALHEMAARRLAHERIGHSLTPSALANEAFVKLFPQGSTRSFKDRRVFYAAAAQAMKRILIDSARRHKAKKRGGPGRPIMSDVSANDSAAESVAKSARGDEGGMRRVHLDLDAIAESSWEEGSDADWGEGYTIHDALTDLAKAHPVAAEIVNLRCYVGLTHKEASQVMEISEATVNRHWALARAWLKDRLKNRHST